MAAQPAKKIETGINKPEPQMADVRVHVQTIEHMNAQLAKFRLLPLQNRGTRRDGFYILNIANITANPWFAIVEYTVERPDGTVGPYSWKYATAGDRRRAVQTIAMVTDERGEPHVFFTWQHRLCGAVEADERRSWLVELPREWAVTGDMVTALAPKAVRDDQAVAVLGRELQPIMRNDLVTIERRTLIGDEPEDSGFSTVYIYNWLLEMRTTDFATLQAIRGDARMGIRCLPYEEVRRRRKDLRIGGQHTLAGLYLLDEHFRSR